MSQQPTNKIAALVPDNVAKAAEFYAGTFGWRVFPLHEMSGAVCSCSKGAECKSPGKHPRISIPKGQSHPATADVDTVRKWWSKWPGSNIGIWLEGSGILVLDIDKNDKKDGYAELNAIMAAEGQSAPPETLTCITPSGGRHLYFELRDGVPNRANSLGGGLDTWHSQHYVIVPPSNHHAGKLYEWDPKHTVGTPQPYPDWLMPKDRAPKPDPTKNPKKGRPPKERLDPNDPDDVERIGYALAFVDNTDRDIWVSVGFALARAFEWSEKGFAIYDKWASAAHNYHAGMTHDQYYVQSKTVAANPITTASIFEWAKRNSNYKAWQPTDNRPYEIRYKPANERETLGDMLGVIHDFPIYQRSTQLVEIVPVQQDTQDDDMWQPKGSFILRETQAPQLASRILPEKVRWLAKTAKGWKATHVHMGMSSTFLGIGNWPGAKRLRAFVQHPTLRDDGTLVTQRGYDTSSCLFVTEEVPITVKPKPTLKDAKIALKELMLPFSEYRWIDGKLSEACLLAAILTVGVRHLFNEGVPLFAIDAPVPGSGKSKLVKAISMLWFGHAPPVTPYSSEPEEMKKHLAALLLAGSRIVMFDNIAPSVRVNDPTLNALITSGSATFRELGSQRMLELASASTFFATGNQLKIVGDMMRRTIKMQIDPGGLHPHLRSFQYEPLEGWVLDHRPELISHALTILSAYFMAGKPKMSGNEPPLASFEQWSAVIRECVMWLGVDDIKESIGQSFDQDEDSMEMEHLLRELFSVQALTSDVGVPSNDLLPMVLASKQLQEALMPFVQARGFTGLHHPRQITTALTKVVNIAVDGKKLVRAASRWFVRTE